MTTRQVVQVLRSRGHQVRYYERKDGSIRITQIDKEKFSHRFSLGNSRARQMIGQSLGESELAQRSRASIYEGRGRRKAGREYTLKGTSKHFQSEYRKIQKQFREYRKTLPKGQDNPFAYIRADTSLKALSYLGEEGLLQKLREQADAIRGLARKDQMIFLKNRLDNLGGIFEEISNKYLNFDLRGKYKPAISAGAIDISIRYLYDLEKGDKTEEEIAQKIRDALELTIQEAPKTEQEKFEYSGIRRTYGKKKG